MSRLKLSILKKLLRAFRDGHTIASACKISGIAVSTYFNWCVKMPKLESRVEKIKSMRVPLVIDSLYQQALKGDVNAIKSYLLNRASWKMGDPKEGTRIINQNNMTQNAAPKADDGSDEERLKRNADLIRKFRLVDRYGSAEGESIVPGVCAEGQQREECSERPDTSGDSGTHSSVQAE